MSNARRPLIAGNWKMNCLQAEGKNLANSVAAKLKSVASPQFDMLICPPFTLVASLATEVGASGLYIGAQDCHVADKGAHTGDISATMLKDIGCSHVIVGHSERRTDHKESDDLICAKAEAVINASMIAIVCIGETEAERDAGDTLNVVRRQINASVPASATAANTVVAYEPVWAIGTGRTPTAAEVQEVHADIRQTLIGKLGAEIANGIRLLYGGSMKPSNAQELLALPDVDGGLIGGAALKAEDFWAIAESCPSK